MKQKLGPQRKPTQGWGIALNLFSGTLWGVAIFMVVFTVFLVIGRDRIPFKVSAQSEAEAAVTVDSEVLESLHTAPSVPLPTFVPAEPVEDAIARETNGHTVLPTRARDKVVEYTVQKGDSMFGIANKYDLKPETILWANYTALNDDPHMIGIGLDLKIPPTDGIYYQWKEGDTLDKIASTYRVDASAIVGWPGNKLDLTNPQIEPDTFVMIPGGWREMRTWVVPTVWRSGAGASKSIPGGCSVEGGAFGTGSFVWPADNHYLSGNDYWSGHLALDIAAGTGAPLYAADSGVVVYAGPIGGGYGNMIMIDHGNGYHTLYAHLSSVGVRCGASVSQGQYIGLAGSTGNSTGPHLHFEVRYMGGFVNPWQVLP